MPKSGLGDFRSWTLKRIKATLAPFWESLRQSQYNIHSHLHLQNAVDAIRLWPRCCHQQCSSPPDLSMQPSDKCLTLDAFIPCGYMTWRGCEISKGFLHFCYLKFLKKISVLPANKCSEMGKTCASRFSWSQKGTPRLNCFRRVSESPYSVKASVKLARATYAILFDCI